MPKSVHVTDGRSASLAVIKPPVVFSHPLEEPNSRTGKICALKPGLRCICQLMVVDRVDVATEFLAHVLADEKLSSLAAENPLRPESIIALSHEYFEWLKKSARECASKTCHK